ncbi:MAG: hypothetical protein IJ247_00760 [Bacilli bacterium]|nr:hypothetical protein [Bacilli bacterium]
MHTLHVYHTRFGKVVIYYDDGGRERKIKSNLVDEVEDAACEIIDIANSDNN